MRRLLSFECAGSRLAGSLDEAAGKVGVLIVTGGTQTRIGSHRMFERLATALAATGYSCFRFDRRGVGDSDGTDPDFRGNVADITAAAAAFRRESPRLTSVIGFGLCDGATSLALCGAEPKLDGMILVNPWLVEAEAGAPAPAAIKHHYRKRLLSIEGWKKVLTGSISYRKLLDGLKRAAAPVAPSSLADEVAVGLQRANLPVVLVLASDDGTAVAAAAAWNAQSFRARTHGLNTHVLTIPTDSHTFARPGDSEALFEATRDAIERLTGSGRD